ncbi:hypothetical protein L1047_10670 [Synechococcus sp. Nb3U1]|uniref:hypothetical protein n=1 Tax=Synechococcus sp. Nb3U1 TaxID=1914529 RepID=UPI001F3FD8D3|nr:hypothetical protein [Synechococcus sp. Nb3U1]MCF2971656.1 hypothetical protein [Synechococcus sp. Nb3U1]
MRPTYQAMSTSELATYWDETGDPLAAQELVDRMKSDPSRTPVNPQQDPEWPAKLEALIVHHLNPSSPQ